MSLYCFGKIKTDAKTAGSFASALGLDVTIRTEVDANDAQEIESIAELSFDGNYFSICDDSKSRDATGLWIQAMSRSPERVMESRLGKVIHTLLFDTRIMVGAVAFVDGGIESVLKGRPEQCWTWYLDRIVKPWDTIDNPILIWARPD